MTVGVVEEFLAVCRYVATHGTVHGHHVLVESMDDSHLQVALQYVSTAVRRLAKTYMKKVVYSHRSINILR